MTTQDALNLCTVVGSTVLPPNREQMTLSPKEYTGLKKAIIGIGGKWKGGKTQAFIFDNDPTGLLAEIQGGKKINLKKDYQFFETPTELAKRLVELAEIQGDKDYVLEPSAGRGRILEEIYKKSPYVMIGIEIQTSNRISWKEKNFIGSIRFSTPRYEHEQDFLKTEFPKSCNNGLFDKIIANPPFSKNQDIDHIRKMYELLADNGRIVSIASVHWANSNNKKEMAFNQWLDDVKAQVIPLPAGTFKEYGTMIESCIIIINN